MIRIIDSTLAKIDEYISDRESLYLFCTYMKEIGIIDLQISTRVYRLMKELPCGINFYLKMGSLEKINEYPGVYKYMIQNGSINETDCISTHQLNDIREISYLKSLEHCEIAEIIGLDDLICYDYIRYFSEIRKNLNTRNIIFSPENSCDCATALAVQWLLSGGEQVATSFNGYGNMAPTEEVFVAMRVVNRYKPNQNIEVMEKIGSLLEKITGNTIGDRKPIIGKKIFQVESGIHVDGILKNPSNYEPYDSGMVGKKTEIVIGKYSGTNSIKAKSKELGIGIDDKEILRKILKKVKIKSMDLKRCLENEEFDSILKEVISDGKKVDS